MSTIVSVSHLSHKPVELLPQQVSLSHFFCFMSNLDNLVLWDSLYSLFLCPHQMQDKRSDTAGRQTGPARIVVSEACVGCILASQQEV